MEQIKKRGNGDKATHSSTPKVMVVTSVIVRNFSGIPYLLSLLPYGRFLEMKSVGQWV